MSSNAKNIELDVDKIAVLQKQQGLFAWLIVCGYGKLPTTSSGKTIKWTREGDLDKAKGTQYPLTTKKGTKYCVRRIFKASSTRPRLDKPHSSDYVILLEVVL